MIHAHHRSNQGRHDQGQYRGDNDAAVIQAPTDQGQSPQCAGIAGVMCRHAIADDRLELFKIEQPAYKQDIGLHQHKHTELGWAQCSGH